jgi:ElaB/YqjD/DUF883 family membrane-anchored ribosome-binding protein
MAAEMEHQTARHRRGHPPVIGTASTPGALVAPAFAVNKTPARALWAKAELGALPMAQSSYGRESDQLSDLKDKATDQFSRVADHAESMANQAVKQGREAGERMQEVATNFKSALDKSLSEQPMATLATAAILGFVLGALWKS